MLTYLKENYVAEKYSDVDAKVFTRVLPLGSLLSQVKQQWGKDYYLTLFAYQALKDAITANEKE